MRRTLCALFLLLLCPAAAFGAISITINSPADGAFVSSATVSVAATVTGNGTVTVSVNGIPAPPFGNVFIAPDVPLTDQSPNTLTLTANDDDGVPAMKSITVWRDSSVPILTISNPPDDDTSTPDTITTTTGHTFLKIQGTVADTEPSDPNDPNKPTFTGTLTMTSGFFPTTVTVDNAGSFSQLVNLSEGANTITVRYTDKAGNASTKTVVITRTRVCSTKTDFPPPTGDPNDVAGSQNYIVDRDDDLPDASLDDPNCDVRPQWRPIPSDPNDPNTPFVPPSVVGHCTLRAAVQQANHHPGPDTISLFGTRKIVLTRKGGPEGTPGDAALGDLDVTDDLRIAGGSRDAIVIDGKKLGDRVFDVAPNVRFELVNLTVENGRTPKPDPNDPNAPVERGGCIRSQGRLDVRNVAALSCTSDDAGGAFSLEDGNAAMVCAVVARNKAKTDGGAIRSEGVTLALRNSTLSINSASGRGGGISMTGNEDPNNLVLTNDTLSQNKAKVAGGALDLGTQVTATLNNLTFANNAAKAGSSISTTDNASVSFSNSIFGDKSKSSCDPNSPEPVVSAGSNIERGDTCHLASLGDMPLTDPQLLPLATNNGTPTHLLKDTSPAIDAGGKKNAAACETLDQRDVERGRWPSDPNQTSDSTPPFCDIGAVELRTAAPQ